jgi:hypothetical protein
LYRFGYGWREIATAISTSAWSLPDWLTIVGFPLVLLGLALGYSQLRETQRQSAAGALAAQAASTSADEARMAIERTEQHLADNHLLLLIPELQQLRTNLDLAVDQGNREETIRLLGSWLRVASDVQAILERQPSQRRALIKELEKSAKMTGQAKDELIARQKNLEQATRDIRSLITSICASALRIVGEMKAFTRSDQRD